MYIRFAFTYGLAFFLLVLISCSSPEHPSIGFTKIPASKSGIDFANTLEETHSYNYFTYPYMYLGGGVAIADINNDGLEDIFFSGNMVENKLYLNRGDFRFEDITVSAGIQGDDRWYSGVSFVDINTDGFVDLYCSVNGKFGPHNNELYINNGDNTFTEKAADFGIDCPNISMQSTFFDYDLDGDLDLYVANYPPTSFVAPVEYYHYMLENHPKFDSDQLFRNDGGKFTDVTEEAGLRNFGLSLGVVASDINNDGYPDIFISNDFNAPDFLYLNNQDGTFTDITDTSLQQISFFGMGADISDYNNDGLVDIFQLDMSAEDNFRSKANMSAMDPAAFYSSVGLGLNHQYMYNSLQLNQGSLEGEIPMFSNVSRLAGVASTDWSWAGLVADFDNDGWKDIFVTNGVRRDVNNKDFYAEHREFFNKMENDSAYHGKEEQVELKNYLDKLPSQKMPNYMFQNQHDLTFKKVADAWGFKEETFSNGVAFSDLDNDGDLDLVINNLEDIASIYRNESSNNYLTCEIDGDGKVLEQGTRLFLYTTEGFQMQECNQVRGYLSSVTPRLHFGLGDVERVDSLVIQWSDGKKSVLTNVKSNQFLELSYSDFEKTDQEKDFQPKNRLFTNRPMQEPFKHRENNYNDFEIEVLLPHKNSTWGPCLAVGDLNEDGLDDYVAGGAIGQVSEIYLQTSQGDFELLEIPDFVKDRYHEDLGIELFDADGDEDLDIYIVSGGNELPAGSPAYEDRLYINQGNGAFSRATNALPKVHVSGRAVSACDYDQDGDLDLFVGGRLVPRNYPKPAASYILRNESTDEIRFEQVESEGWDTMGLVTDAKWIDFDADGWQDLVLVGEWMPITFLKNNQGTFENVTKSKLPGNTRGWWYSVAEGDFDGDGDVDLIAGNLGKNYKYKASNENPFKIYLNDFDRNRTGDIVLSYEVGDTEYPVRGRQCSSEQMPAIKMKFKDYNSFASATLSQIYTTEMLENSLSYEVQSFASVYLENVDGTFNIRPLPNDAQISSINEMLVNDFNGDGHLDVVAMGNLYNAEVETPRNDASFGWYLAGDGKGNFRSVPMNESGLMVVGDVRGLEFIKVEGKSHMLVARNDDYVQMIEIQQPSAIL